MRLMPSMNDPILVPIDGSRAADAGLAYALRLAAALKTRVVLLHVIDGAPRFLQSAGALDEHLAALRDYGEQLLATAAVTVQDCGLQVSYFLRETADADASTAILAEAAAQHCGLIVLGTHGRRTHGKLPLGRDAELVLRDSAVPVLFVRSPFADEAGPPRHGSTASDPGAIAA